MLRPKIHNAMELEALVRWIDFLPVFVCSVGNLSVEKFTLGRC